MPVHCQNRHFTDHTIMWHERRFKIDRCWPLGDVIDVGLGWDNGNSRI
jgi:hypothetical protein